MESVIGWMELPIFFQGSVGFKYLWRKTILRSMLRKRFLILPLVAHRKKGAQVKRIILDSGKDHFISDFVVKKTCKKTFDSLVELFQNSCASQQMLLWN